MTAPFPSVITSIAELRGLIQPPSEMVCRQGHQPARRALPHPDRARAVRGAGDVVRLGRLRRLAGSGDAPGFVLVLDERRLVLPDRPGNRRLDNMQNILENPHVGLLFLIPGLEETLRVNGRAWLTRDEEILGRMAVGAKRPVLGIGVEVDECFIHCAKAFKRSGLWEPSRWPDRSDLPSIAQVLVDHLRAPGLTADAVDRSLQESYKTTLY